MKLSSTKKRVIFVKWVFLTCVKTTINGMWWNWRFWMSLSRYVAIKKNEYFLDLILRSCGIGAFADEDLLGS